MGLGDREEKTISSNDFQTQQKNISFYGKGQSKNVLATLLSTTQCEKSSVYQ